MAGPAGKDNIQDFVIIFNQAELEKFITEMTYGMMFDDAHADWGHRYTTVWDEATMVNIGISWSDNCSAPVIIQHFETPQKIIWEEEPNFDGTKITLKGRTSTTVLVEEQLNVVRIFFESPLKELSYEELEKHNGYQVGRNCSYNTDKCLDIAADIWAVPFCAFCPEKPGETYAETWTTFDLDGVYNFEITIDVSSIIEEHGEHGTNGIFTIELWLADEDLGNNVFGRNLYATRVIW